MQLASDVSAQAAESFATKETPGEQDGGMKEVAGVTASGRWANNQGDAEAGEGDRVQEP